MDIFEKIRKDKGPLGQYAQEGHGYFFFPKLEGEIHSRMNFRDKKNILVWSINNYLGLANHPEIRKADAEATANYGLAYPMGARMMSGQTEAHETLEQNLAKFVGKEAAYLLNYGYQGCVSVLDAVLDRHDVVVYDAESHACMIDGLRLHLGKRFVYQHNDIESLEKQLIHAQKVVEQTGGGILVATEGVFGMAGDQGKLKEIVALKEKYDFRLFVDDAHGFGAMGKTGAGTAEHQNVIEGVDLYFATFAKAFAAIGAFIAADEDIIQYLQYNMRSQIYAKALPMPFVIGGLKRLELIQTRHELREKLWEITHALQNGLREAGFDIGRTNSPVTPVFLQGSLQEATNVTFDLRENYGIFCSMVIYPVVPKGVIMLRLIPTATHTLEDVDYTIETFKKVREKLNAKEYSSQEYAVWS